MTITEHWSLNGEQASATVDVTLPGGSAPDQIITGDFSGAVPAGQHYDLQGNVNLTGDVMVLGLLTGSDAVVQGNQHEIMVMNGGRVDLRGTPLPAWELTDEIDHTFSDGSVVYKYQINHGQSLRFHNLSRFMFHQGADPIQQLEALQIEGSGVPGQLGFYPLHFHENGPMYGTLVKDVLILNGLHNAFVPHGSHGIVFDGCVAENINVSSFVQGAFGWDPPPSNQQQDVNATHDTIFQDCLVHGASGIIRTSGFNLRHGNGNQAVNCRAAHVQGNDAGGASWPEKGSGVWVFAGFIAHDCDSGIWNWQNNNDPHPIDDFRIYRCGTGIFHGAYRNGFDFLDGLIEDSTGYAIEQHANSKGQPNIQQYVNIITDGSLLISRHNLPEQHPTEYHDCAFPEGVVYDERPQDPNANPSTVHFHDCDLGPADFTMTNPHPGSVVVIFEGGSEVHRWENGTWILND